MRPHSGGAVFYGTNVFLLYIYYMKLFYSLSLVGLFFLVACVSAPKSEAVAARTDRAVSTMDSEALASQVYLDVHVLLQGAHSRRGEAEVVIIDNSVAFNRLWNELSSTGRPDIDFSVDRVVAVFMGQRNTGGFFYEAGQAFLNEAGRVELDVIEQVPGKDQMVTMALTRPFIVIRIAKNSYEPIVKVR